MRVSQTRCIRRSRLARRNPRAKEKGSAFGLEGKWLRGAGQIAGPHEQRRAAGVAGVGIAGRAIAFS